MTLHGVVRESTPVLFARVVRGRLRIASRGPVRLVVDTGFTGTLSLPERVASRLMRELIAIDTFILATGDRVDLPVYSGMAHVGMRRVDTWFTIGEGLIGMEFLERVCSDVHVDLNRRRLELVLK